MIGLLLLSVVLVGTCNIMYICEKDGAINRLNVIVGIYAFPVSILFYIVVIIAKFCEKDYIRSFCGKHVGRLW